MITAFVTRSTEFPDIETIYISKSSAQEHIRRFLPDMYVEEREIDSLPPQVVYVDGGQIGYQFSRTTMGERKLRRAVRNLRHEDGKLFGEVKYKERIITVKWWVANLWQFHSLGWEVK